MGESQCVAYAETLDIETCSAHASGTRAVNIGRHRSTNLRPPLSESARNLSFPLTSAPPSLLLRAPPAPAVDSLRLLLTFPSWCAMLMVWIGEASLKKENQMSTETCPHCHQSLDQCGCDVCVHCRQPVDLCDCDWKRAEPERARVYIEPAHIAHEGDE